MFDAARRAMAIFKKAAPQVVIPANEQAWSETSMYRNADFPKYNPDALLSRKGYGIYTKMMTDEQIKAVVRFKRDAITSRDWEFELDDESLSETEVDLRKAVFSKCVKNMEAPFSDSLNGIMSAMYNGFSMTEKVLGADLVHEGKAYVGIKKLKLKPCDTFYFHVDEYGNVDKLTQKFDSKEQEVDIERMIHFVQNPDYDEHYGRSELRECYRAWFSKDMVIKFQNIHLERFAAGFVWAQPIAGKTLVAGSQEYTSLQQVMSNLQGTSSIILPSGIELNIEHPATTDAFERAISQHDKSIAKCLLVPNLMGISEQGSTGSYAQSQTQLEAFLWTLDADATRLEAVLNAQLFKELGDLNFGDSNYPRFKFKPVSDVRKLEIVKIWLQLVTAGAVQATDVDEAYIRDALEMPKKTVIEGDAPDLILNGAQVTALTGIVAQVGAGTLSPEAAKALITAVFPITEEQAGAMVDSAKVEKPEPAAGDLPPVTDANGKPLTPAQEETIVGKMGISVSAFRKMFWNEDQPRDDSGRWGEGGSAGGAAAATGAHYTEAELLRADALYEEYESGLAIKESSRGVLAVQGDLGVSGSPITHADAAELNAAAKVLQHAAESNHSAHALLYRGVVFESEADIPKEWLQRGAVVEAGALTSTSADRELATMYTEPQFIGSDTGAGVLLRYSNHGARKHQGYDRKSSGAINETLLPKGAKYKVGSIQKLANGTTMIDMYRPKDYYVGSNKGYADIKSISKFTSDAAFSRAMKRVDFAVIANKADNSIADSVHELAVINSAAVARLVAVAEELKLGTADGKPEDMQKIQYTASEMSALKAAVTKGLKDSWVIGETHAKRELAKAQGGSDFKVNDLALQDLATAYLKQKGYTLAGDISAATQKTIRNILMEGIKVSKAAAETKRAIYKALEADGMLTEEAVVEALGAQTVKNASARIDTAIRTTSFEAINEARYSFFSDPALDGFVEALEYSAILDDRTTEICSQLDSQTYSINDEVWSTFRPPNHFNCRSILIPVTVRDTWAGSDAPSVLPQKGFGFNRCNHDIKQ